MKLLSDFLDVGFYIPHWNGRVWYAGHCGSGREPSSSKYDPRKNGREHNGCDLACQRKRIHAPHSGLCRYARWQGNGAGHAVTLNHGDTLIDVGARFYGEIRRVYSRHLHMDPDSKWATKTFLVKEGEQVIRGQAIGIAGNSGSSAGIHVHSELVIDAPYQAAYKHMNLDSELVYTGQTTGYWGGGESEVAMVEDIQTNLNKGGFTDDDGKPLKIDGKWGAKTTQAHLKMVQAAGESGGNGHGHTTVQLTVAGPPI